MIIVSDSSPLISFVILNKLDILSRIFDEIYIPNAVFEEITQQNKPHSQELKNFAAKRVKHVQNQFAVQLLEKELDTGESEAIVLAKENNIYNILIDEYKGRRIAQTHNLSPIGTIGVLVQAKKKRLIKELKPELDKLVANHRRISHELYKKALDLAGEK
jgi:predicted nucleic acid-binding protein